MAIEAEIQATKEKNKAEAVRSKNNGQKLTEKTLNRLYKKYMKSRFDQWKMTLID